MNQFQHRNGIMHAEDVSLPDIAAAVGTPVYVYSASAVAEQYRRLSEGLSGLDHLICYALKANSNQALLKLLAGMGAGFDAVSGGEIARVLAAGAPGDRIVFSGVGKTRMEMRDALLAGVRQFNVESEPELELLNEVALSMGTRAPVAVRINPDVDPKTHRKISTGKSENKFGIPLERARNVYETASAMDGIRIAGLDLHIGSQLTSLAPLERAYRKAADLVAVLRSDGFQIDRIDLGGGLGIAYDRNLPGPPTIEQWCDLIGRETDKINCEIVIEPGRLLVGGAGILLASVLYLKRGHDRRFLVIDAAMNDLLRPSMYDAHHEVLTVRDASDAESAILDVVGPICESGDTLAVQRSMQLPAAGDLVAIMSAGAYSSAMASEYNSRPLVPEVLVSGNRFAVVRERNEIGKMIARDRIPNWL